jgi:flagellar hook assembly protein FlgD
LQPNPFNPSTSIPITLDEARHADLRIFDVSGRLVRRLLEARLAAGHHPVTWDGRASDGRALASGVYFAQLRLDGIVVGTRKATLAQ